MSDSTGFLWLTATVVCVIASPAAIYYAVKTNRLLPGIMGGVLAGIAMLCSLPFRNTYEAPWLPGIVVLFFFAVACAGIYKSVSRTDRHPDSDTTHGVRFGLRSILAVMLLFCCGFSWIAFVNNSNRERLAAQKEIEAYHTVFNTDSGTLTLADGSLTDDDLPRLIPGLLNYPFSLRTIDLSKTAVTDKGVERLQSAIPNCDIHR